MTKITRRAVLAGATAVTTLGLSPRFAFAQNNGPPRAPAPKGTRLVMLGTRGGPGVDATRGETASAVLVDGVPYLLDCGYGMLRALITAGIRPQSLDTIFISHLHNDHTADLAALLSHAMATNGDYTTPSGALTGYNNARLARTFNIVFSVTPVPLPAAAWLFGSGLVSLVAIARRRSSV